MRFSGWCAEVTGWRMWSRPRRCSKMHGFKVHYHWMPGLPGSTPDHDLEMSRLLFDDPRFRPDGLKIYPTMVVKGTELEKWYADGRYQPV